MFFASGAFWSLTGMTFAALTDSKYMAYASPFVLFYLLIILYERYFDKLFVLYPREWLSPSPRWVFGKIGVAVLLTEFSVLMALAFVFSLIVGGMLGVIAARSRYTNQKTWLDSAIMSISLLFYATPLFWLSLLMVILFSVTLGWLPAFGMESVGAGHTGWARVQDISAHLVLPVVSLGCFFMAVYARLARASMLEVMGMDFVKTARAKGVPSGLVIRRHVMRNAMLPVVTFAGIQLGQMAGGAVLTETVFGWPGIGRLMFDALMQRDYQLLLGVFLVTSTMVVLFNLITDLVYRLVDPRIEMGS